MKNVFLIGDSIRYGEPPGSPGYGIFVKKKLEGKANVYYPDDNCRWAQYTQRYIREWASAVDREKIDVVHWNNGLWDVLRLDGDEPLTPLEQYVETLKRVYGRIKYHFPNAKIIFALSTSVMEEMANPNFFRYNREIEEYNKAAKELMASLGVEVNDLYSLTKDFGKNLRSDWVHFNEKGSEIIADQVIKYIMKQG